MSDDNDDNPAMSDKDILMPHQAMIMQRMANQVRIVQRMCPHL